MKQSKNVEIKFRCTEEDKRLLSQLAEATKESESEVLRQLIHLGWKQFHLDHTARVFDGDKSETFVLSLGGGEVVMQNMLKTLAMISVILQSRGRPDLATDIFTTLLSPENRDFAVSSLKDIFTEHLEISMQNGADDGQ